MKRLILLLTGGCFIATLCMPIQSCVRDEDDLAPQTQQLTKADLFVASPAYQKLSAEIEKTGRMLLAALDKMTPEGRKNFQNLLLQFIDSDDPAQRAVWMKEINEMTGFDNEERAAYINGLFDQVYAGSNFSSRELIQAEYKYRVARVNSPMVKSGDEGDENPDPNPDKLAGCLKSCDLSWTRARETCGENYTGDDYHTCCDNAAMSYSYCVTRCRESFL